MLVLATKGPCQGRRDSRIPQGNQGLPETAGAIWDRLSHHRGRLVCKPLELGRAQTNCRPVNVRAGHLSGRVPRGLAKAPRSGQLLLGPEQTANARIKSTQTVDHRSLLDATYSVVIS